MTPGSEGAEESGAVYFDAVAVTTFVVRPPKIAHLCTHCMI